MKRIKKYLFRLFIFFLLYILFIKFINPPITIFQLGGIYYTLDSEKYDFRRDYISYEEMGENIKLAAIAGEDQRFPTHGGFDWVSINNSIKNKQGGKAASTISQQMVKNAFLFQGKGFFKYFRKVLEFPTTFIVEKLYSKKRILEIYLNIAETGPGIYGVEAAAQYYFNKPAKDLTKTEAAKIIACFPNPKKYLANGKGKSINYKTQWIIKQMNNLKTDKKIKKLIH